MRWAIIAVTARGAALAERMQGALEAPADCYIKQGTGRVEAVTGEYTELRACVQRIFHRYEALVFIAATGIAVRMIAPYLETKTVDPAVLVVDERAQHVISLLSGHFGGANRLAKELASRIGAVPVITTATDVNGTPAADVIAAELDLYVSPMRNLKKVNGALAAGQKVAFCLAPDLAGKEYYRKELRARGIEDVAWENLASVTGQPVVLLTEKCCPVEDDNTLLLLPRRLVVGIGCRRGASKAYIFAAIDAACARLGKKRQDIACLASTTVKAGEGGLLAAAAELGVPISFYGNEVLQPTIERYGLTVSPFVQEQIGIGNVCEAAAIYASESKRIILPKEKYEKVTVAIAWEK